MHSKYETFRSFAIAASCALVLAATAMSVLEDGGQAIDHDGEAPAAVQEPEASAEPVARVVGQRQAVLERSETAAEPDQPAASQPAPDMKSLDAQALVEAASVETSSLFPAVAGPVLSEEHLDGINRAIAEIEQDGVSCSFMLLSLDDAGCIQYRRDRSFYSASTMKAVFVYYILSNFPDTLTDEVWEDIENAIVYSDNGAYESLRVPEYYNDAYTDWLVRYGIFHTLDGENGNYAYVSSASLCAVWLDIAVYLNSGMEEADRFAELLASTKMSFIRDGLGEDASVMNKGGWIAEYDGGLNATNDAGIVEMSGRRYVMSIMTSQPYSQTAAEKVGKLARALMGVGDEDAGQTSDAELAEAV